MFLVCRDFLFLSHSAAMDHIIEYLLCHNSNILKKSFHTLEKNLHLTQVSMVLHLIIQNRNVIKSHHLTNRVSLSQVSTPPLDYPNVYLFTKLPFHNAKSPFPF